MKKMFNKVFIFFWYIYFLTFKDLCLRRKANKRYRLIQKGDNLFEIQCYQCVSIVSRSGETGYPDWRWAPLLISDFSEIEEVNKDCYKNKCNGLRHSEYIRLRDEYEMKIVKYKKPKYPKIIY